MTAKRICVGVFGGAFGVRGEARLKSYTDDPEAIFAYSPLRDEDDAAIRLTRVGRHKDGFRVRIAGVDTREAAEALKNRRLYVDRDALPPPDDADEFYHADLIGLKVVDDAGAELGVVCGVADYGAGAVLEIAIAAAVGDGSSVFAPFTREIAPVVDLDAGVITLNPPPGLFDDANGDADAPADADGRRGGRDSGGDSDSDSDDGGGGGGDGGGGDGGGGDGGGDGD